MNQFQKSQAEKILSCYTQENDLEKGGKRAMIGEVRKYNNQDWVKHSDGWVLLNHSTGKHILERPGGKREEAGSHHVDHAKKHLGQDTSKESTKEKQSSEEQKNQVDRDEVDKEYIKDQQKKQEPKTSGPSKEEMIHSLSLYKPGAEVTLKTPIEMTTHGYRGPTGREVKTKKVEVKKISFGGLSPDKTRVYITYTGPGIRSSSSMSVKDFFSKTSARIIQKESEEDIIGEVPSQEEIGKIISLGESDHTFSQGGFLTSTRTVYKDHEHGKRAISLANRAKTRKQIIKLAKAAKSVFGEGTYRSPYKVFMDRARELKCTPKEIEDIESYTEKVDTTKNIKW